MPDRCGGPLYELLYGLIPPLAAVIIAFAIVLLSGLLFNIILYQYKMISQNTLYPMLFYILAMSLGAQFQTLTPFVICSPIIVLLTSRVMVDSSLLTLSTDKTFEASMLIAIATLICPACLVLYVALLANFTNYRMYQWRDWLMLFLGALAPCIVLEMVYFLNDSLFFSNYLLWHDLITWRPSFGGTTLEWIASGIYAGLTLIAITAAFTSGQKQPIIFQKNANAIGQLSIAGALMVAYGQIMPFNVQLFAPVFAFGATAIFYPKKQKEWIWSIILILLFIVAIIWNYA